MPGMGNKYKLVKKAMEAAASRNSGLKGRMEQARNQIARPTGIKQDAVKATRPAGSVRPVIQGGGGAKLPSLNERRNDRRRMPYMPGRRRFM